LFVFTWLAKTQAHAAKGTIFSVYGKTFVYKEKELRLATGQNLLN